MKKKKGMYCTFQLRAHYVFHTIYIYTYFNIIKFDNVAVIWFPVSWPYKSLQFIFFDD